MLKDGLWIVGSHALTAFVTLAGVRLITELVAPPLFGAFALLNGVLALLQGILFQPMAQAAQRYYPDFAAVNGASVLRRHLFSAFQRRWLWGAAVISSAAIADTLTRQRLSVEAWLLVAVALALESWKTVEIVMYNAARRQAAYAALFAADSIARLAGAVLTVWAFGASLESLLLGQTLGVLLVLCGLFISSPAGKGESSSTGKPAPTEICRLKLGMTRFAAPLVWASLVAWVSGLADRYIVGGMLGVGPAGIYAAAYGLASRPMLMIGSVSDATLRPVLYAAVATSDDPRARRTFVFWVGVNLLLATTAAAMLGLFNIQIVRWLLAEEYQAGAAELLPWLALGYVPLLVSQAFERLAHARHRTRATTLVQAASAGVSIVAAILGAWWGGLMGVALAVPVYFSVHLILTIPIAIQSSEARPT